jgi:putative tryptophan/tyrosine transport system substrate-binding protein
MRRREFVALLSVSAASPLATVAQQRKPTIGFLGAGTPSTWSHRVASFVQRLGELGWFESRTVAIEYRWADGNTGRYSEIAAEFVRLNVDVIVTGGTPSGIAAKRATSAIPIVVAASGDPVGTGLVASLGHPGGNVTGLSNQQPDAMGKRLEILREALPHLRRMGILVNMDNSIHALEREDIEKAAPSLGIGVVTVEIRRANDIAPAFGALHGNLDALYIAPDPLLFAEVSSINTLALAARLPTIYGSREYVEGGGLLSYGPDIPDLYRRAADYVDKILRGTKPADLPVEQATKFDFVLNLKTARALGLTIPPTLLARADEVIE